MTEFILNCLIILVAPLFYSGLILFIRTGGKHGSGKIVEPLKTFLSLLFRGVKAGSDKNFFHETASSVILASILMAGALTPLIGHRAILNFDGAFFLFFSFLVIEKIDRVFGKTAPGKKDRKIVLRERAEFLPETALYAVLVLSCVIDGQGSFEKLFSFGESMSPVLIGAKVLFLFALWLVLVREENGDTFGYEGSDRAVVLYGGSLKSLLVSSLMAGMVIPYTDFWNQGMNAFLYLLLYLLLIVLIGSVAGFVQRILAHFRKPHFADTALAVSVGLIICLSLAVLLA